MNKWKAYLLFSLSILLALSVRAQNSSTAPARVIVISDIDDTIKISYVRNKMEMVSFSAYSDSLYYGMDQLYRNIKNETGAQFYYVSKGWKPTIEEVHQRLMKNFNFPEGAYVGRDNPFDQDFKFEMISKIIEQENPTLVIMIGDNGQADPLSYHRIVEKFKNQSIQFRTFIHKVYDHPLPEVAEASQTKSGIFPEQFEYLNPAELSDLLFQAGLQTEAESFRVVKNVRDTIFEQKAYSVYGPLVSPYFQSHQPVANPKIFCSKVFKSPTAADQMLQQIRERMRDVSPKGGN